MLMGWGAGSCVAVRPSAVSAVGEGADVCCELG